MLREKVLIKNWAKHKAKAKNFAFSIKLEAKLKDFSFMVKTKVNDFHAVLKDTSGGKAYGQGLISLHSTILLSPGLLSKYM